MTELKTFCGADCGQCGLKDECAGCAPTNGRPFGGACIVAECCIEKGCGLTADENHLLVCEYGEGGSDTGIVLFKRRG